MVSAAVQFFQRPPQELYLLAVVAVEMLGRTMDNNLIICYNKQRDALGCIFLHPSLRSLFSK